MTQANGGRYASINGSSTANQPYEQFKPTASHDFRSDTLTTPTKAMLDAIYSTTYYDDGYAEDLTTNALESHVAQLTGKEGGLLVMSGVMGNQVAIRCHLTAPPHSVICDSRSHIANYEAGGLSTISGAFPIIVEPRNGHHLTLEDIQKRVIISDNVHFCPTKLICLENTVNGLIMPIEEIRRISEWAKGNDIKVHLDGARLWEAAAAGAGALHEFAGLVDSVSLCFSKGLGAPLGSIVVGKKDFVEHGRRIRKMLGGGGRQSGVISAAAKVAVEHGFGEGPDGQGGHLRACHKRAKAVGESWQRRGGELKTPVETNMVWLDVAGSGGKSEQITEFGQQEGITVNGERIVCHYQLAEDAYEKLEKVFDAALGPKKDGQ